MMLQTVTAKGQVTLRRELLSHMGIGPGDRIVLDKTDSGEVRIKAARPTGSISDIFGMFEGCADRAYTIEEINDAIAAGWADKP